LSNGTIPQISLAFPANRSDRCRHAVITAKGDIMTSIPEQAETTQPAESVAARPTKKATPGARRANVATKKGKSGKKASQAKKAPTGANKATGARDGSKTATILDLLKRKDGATLKELMKASGWQPHSIRGFLSGTVSKKMKLAVVSTKGEDGERNYSVKA
jgi:hypothetical protein